MQKIQITVLYQSNGNCSKRENMRQVRDIRQNKNKQNREEFRKKHEKTQLLYYDDRRKIPKQDTENILIK